jgi:hypothetical protein
VQILFQKLLFFSVDRISGGRLFDYLGLQSIIIEQKIGKYIRQLLDGLNYLHHCKIVHLDLQVNKVCLLIKMFVGFLFSRKIFLLILNMIS